MSIFKKNQPSSDKLDNQQYNKLKSLFAKAVGQPKDTKSTQNVLFKQLNNFHEYYGGKIAELNKQIERLKSVVKSVDVEYESMERRLNERQTQFQIISRENQQLTKIIETLKQNQKQQKASDKTDIHHFYESINESYKDKVNNIQAQHVGQLDILRTKLSLMNKQKLDLAKIVQKLTAQNSALKLQIKEYEVEKRYEGDRIKNATLQLQIKIKNQDELISRLSKDLSKDLSVRTNTCRLSDIDKRDILNDSSGGGVLISDSNLDGVLNGSLLDQFKVTNKKIVNLSQFNSKQLLPFQKQNSKKLKYIHSRNLSKGDEQKTPRQQQMKTARDTKQKGHSQLKMKVMRLQKMRRK